MRISIESELPINFQDPHDIVKPMTAKIFARDDDDEEVQVGQICGEIVFMGLLEEYGHRVIDIFDVHAMTDIYSNLFDGEGEWLPELNLNDSIERIVLIHGIFLAPSLAASHCDLFLRIFAYFEYTTLFGLWKTAGAISHQDLIRLGFAKLASTKMYMRHNALRSCPPSRDQPLLFVEPTKADEDWVKSRVANHHFTLDGD
jgi:hypothetical protein